MCKNKNKNDNMLSINVHSLTTSSPFNFDKFIRAFSYKQMPFIDKVIFQKEHTIVVWADGTKTVVRCSEENFDKEKGLAMAICKKYMERNEFKRLLENADIQDK